MGTCVHDQSRVAATNDLVIVLALPDHLEQHSAVDIVPAKEERKPPTGNVECGDGVGSAARREAHSVGKAPITDLGEFLREVNHASATLRTF